MKTAVYAGSFDPITNGLQANWNSLTQRLGLKGGEEHYPAIREKYSERPYHNMGHLYHLCGELELARPFLAAPDAVEMAIFYHDIEYLPGRKDNEELSAQCARGALEKMGGERVFIDTVCSMICATKHPAATEDSDTKYLLDMDLAILGASPLEFSAYEKGIREEYKAVPDNEFFPGRLAFLEIMLKLPEIYHTDYFRQRYKAAARANIEVSITKLSSILQKRN